MQKTHIPQAIRERILSLNIIEQLATLATGYKPDPEREQQEQSYYDNPVMKSPTWSWEIIWYFFFGGLAAGCYIIASIASLFGSREDRVVVRTGYYLSLLALLPCPPLLIKDLGRPERFLNMLRMFKVKSPMSMGTWALLSFSLFSGVTAVIQAARDGMLGRWWGARLLAALPQKFIALPGTAFGAFLGGYTGVLLAATSVPLWSRSKFLGAVFISSAISTSSALISLVLRLVGAPADVLHKLERLEWAALLVEMTELTAFLRGSGRAGRPLVGNGPHEQGTTFWRFVFGGGLSIPWFLQSLALLARRSGKRAEKMTGRSTGLAGGGVSVGDMRYGIIPGLAGKGIGQVGEGTWQGQALPLLTTMLGLISSLLVLMGGYFLRRSMIEAGRTSSRDARTTLWNAKR